MLKLCPFSQSCNYTSFLQRLAGNALRWCADGTDDRVALCVGEARGVFVVSGYSIGEVSPVAHVQAS